MSSTKSTTNASDDGVWKACWDENLKAYYYWNTITNDVTWKKPETGVIESNGNHNIAGETTASDNNSNTTGKKRKLEDSAPEKDVASSTSVNEDNDSSTKIEGTDSKAADQYSDYYQYYQQYYNSYYNQTAPSGKDTTSSTDVATDNTTANTEASTETASTNPSTTYDYSNYSYPYPTTSTSSTADSYVMSANFNSRSGKFQSETYSMDPSSGSVDHFTAQAKAMRQMSHFFDYDGYLEQRNMDKVSGGDGSRKKKKLTKKEIEKFKAKREEKKRKGLLSRLGDG
ncbi:hypothetical protein BKA69DRAFT_1051226 [Paraphysoderma sedebokerense]|nr:hypothetical protein BKA69DRAFT_1051226 [Paraphysoderma sedebokerense]